MVKEKGECGKGEVRGISRTKGSRKDLTTLGKISAELAEAELLLKSLKEYQAALAERVSSDSISDINGDIIELEQGIERLKVTQAAELKSLEEYISSIDDTRAQTYMRLHYVRGLSWEEVAVITNTKSAGVVMEYVQRGLNLARMKKKAPVSFSRKQLTEFAALSAELSVKERAVETFKNHFDAGTSSLEISLNDISGLEKDVDELRMKRERHLRDVEAFIATVERPLVRTYMRLHYIRGMKWDDVAVVTGATSGNAVRTRVLRYTSLRLRGEEGKKTSNIIAENSKNCGEGGE